MLRDDSSSDFGRIPSSNRLNLRIMALDKSSDSDQYKEIFALYGAAMFYAQLMEHGIINAMLAVRLSERLSLTRREIDSLMEDRCSKTLGKLIQLLRSEITCPCDLEEILTRALVQRLPGSRILP